MPQKTFKNIQPNDEFQAVKTGEYFKVIHRLNYYCRNCQCKTLEPCDKFKEKSYILIKSNRGQWNFSLKEINVKFDNNDIKWT